MFLNNYVLYFMYHTKYEIMKLYVCPCRVIWFCMYTNVMHL